MDQPINLERRLSRTSTLTDLSLSILGPMAPLGARHRESIMSKPSSLTSFGSLTSLKNMLVDVPSMSALMPDGHAPHTPNSNCGECTWFKNVSIPGLVRTQSTGSQTGKELGPQLSEDDAVGAGSRPSTPMPDVELSDVNTDCLTQGLESDDNLNDEDENQLANDTTSAPTTGERSLNSTPEVMPTPTPADDHGEEEEMEADTSLDEQPMDAGSFLPGPAPIEVLISFDTTGSMSAILDAVRNNIHEMLTRLFSDIPNLKVALLAHGDYCDEHEFYLTKSVDLTGDLDALVDFLRNTDGTGGGDYEECYELILREARERFSWSAGTQRALVMIGDAVPHEKDAAANKSGLDWREQADKLYQELGVHMYAVHCRQEPGAGKFWQELALRTHGTYLQLNDLRSIVHTLMAICYREAGAQPPPHVSTGANGALGGAFGSLVPSPEVPGTSEAVPGTPRTGKALKKVRVGHTKNPWKRPAKPAKKATKTKVKATTADVKDRRAKASNVRSVDKVAKKAREIKKKSSNRKTTSRRLREVIPDAKTALSHLSWSPWRLALVPTSTTVSSEEWLPRRQGAPGLRRRTLFRSGMQREALYELGVQRAVGCKRYVTFLAATNGIPSDRRWETYLLRSKRVDARVTDVINQNCSVYVRRAFVPPTTEVRRSFHHPVKRVALRDNDYAWNRSLPRYVERRGIRM